jgi:hypothetical protein
MKFVIIPLILLFSFDVHSQKYVFLKSGEKIEYKSLDITNSEVLIKTAQKEVVSAPIANVLSTCEGVMQTATSKSIDWFKNPMFVKYEFEGKINVIAIKVNGGPNMGPLEYYYALKGDSIYILPYGSEIFLKRKKKIRETLTSLIGDLPEFGNVLVDSTKKIEYEEAIKLINQYNLATFTPLDASGNSNTVFFYSNLVVKKDIKVTVRINNEPPKQIPQIGFLSLSLDSKNLSKVCVTVGGIETCNLMRISPCEISYYEIKFNEGGINIKNSGKGGWAYFQKNSIKPR